MDARGYLNLIKRRGWVILLVALSGGAVAWFTAPPASAPVATTFRATHRLVVEPVARDWTPNNPETIALLATEGEVPERVAASFPGHSAAELAGMVSATGDPRLATVEITATADTASEAEVVANIFAFTLTTYLDEREQQARRDAIAEARRQADALQRQANEIDQQLQVGSGDEDLLIQQRDVFLRQYGDAYERYQQLSTLPPADSGLKSLGDAAASAVTGGIQAPRGAAERAVVLGVLGALLAFAAVAGIDRLDTRIRSKEDAEDSFGIPVIAEVPTLPVTRRRTKEVLTFLEPASSFAEAYRVLRTTLLILRAEPLDGPGLAHIGGRRAADRVPVDPEGGGGPEESGSLVVVVTSTRSGEGKTTTSANLAAAFAEAGRSVLLIGADIRRPELHTYVGAPRRPGLSDVLMGGPRAPSLLDVVRPTSIPGVRCIPAGTPVANPGELLLQGADVVEEARSLADIVVIDSTPMINVNDAIQLMTASDAVLVTCRSGRATKQAAKRSHELLARLRAPVAGIVLIGAPETPGVTSYYRGYHQDRRPNRRARPKARARRPAPPRRAPSSGRPIVDGPLRLRLDDHGEGTPARGGDERRRERPDRGAPEPGRG